MKINFIIQGKVQAKQRPRFNGKFAYTPKETVAYENWVKTCYLEKYRGQQPLEQPLKVLFPIAVTLSGNLTLVRLVQFWNV